MAFSPIRFHCLGSASQFPAFVGPWLEFFTNRPKCDEDHPSLDIVFAPAMDQVLQSRLEELPRGTVVYPGPTQALTVSGVEMLRAHGVARIVCDLLPDELTSASAATLWPTLREHFFFLPTLGGVWGGAVPPAGVLLLGHRSAAASELSLAGVSSPLLIEALRDVTTVTETEWTFAPGKAKYQVSAVVVSLSGDVGQVAFEAVRAAESGAVFIDWCGVLSPLREPGLRLLRLDGVSLRAGLTQVLAVARRRVARGDGARPIAPDDWVRALCAELASGRTREEIGTAGIARINNLCREVVTAARPGRELRESLVWRALGEGWYRDGEPLMPEDHSLVARRIRETVTQANFVSWSGVREPHRLASRIVEAAANHAELAALAGLCLIDGVCGGILVGWRRKVAEMAGDLYRRSGSDIPAWLRVRRAALLAALGDCSGAEADWQALNDRPAQGFLVLQECLRLWMPALECGPADRPTREQQAWWWRHCAELETASGSQPAWSHLRWMGRLFGLEAGVVPQAARPEDWHGFTHGMLSGLVLSAWLCGREELAGPAWAELRQVPPPTNHQSLFYWAVAHALNGRNPAAGDWLRQVEEHAPQLLQPQWPPQQCCFLAAAAWLALGDSARAGELLRRALAEEPLARGHLAEGHRAVAADFRMDLLLDSAGTAQEAKP